VLTTIAHLTVTGIAVAELFASNGSSSTAWIGSAFIDVCAVCAFRVTSHSLKADVAIAVVRGVINIFTISIV
jgi:hypothetical protein